MPLFDFGTSSGLAYRHNFNADMARLLQEEAMINNQKAAAEAKAEKLGGMMKFGKGFTKHQQQNIDLIGNESVAEMGKIINENGGSITNPATYARLNQLSNRMVNNEYTIKAKATEKQYEAMSDFLIKNPDLADDPEVNKQLDYWKQFDETGQYDIVDPVTNTKTTMHDFVFRNPINTVNLDEEFSKVVKTKMADKVEFGTPQYGQVPAYFKVSDNNLLAATYSALSDPKVMAAAKKKFEQDENAQKVYSGNIYLWANDMFSKPQALQKTEIVTDLNAYNAARGNGNDKIGIPPQTVRPLINDLNTEAKNSPTKTAQLNPQGLAPILGGAAKADNGDLISTGEYNIVSASGNDTIPNVKLESVMVKPDNIIHHISDDKAYIETTAIIPFKDFKKYTGMEPITGEYDDTNTLFYSPDFDPTEPAQDPMFGSELPFYQTTDRNLKKYGLAQPKAGTLKKGVNGKADKYGFDIVTYGAGDNAKDYISMKVRKYFDPRSDAVNSSYADAIGVTQSNPNNQYVYQGGGGGENAVPAGGIPKYNATGQLIGYELGGKKFKFQ